MHKSFDDRFLDELFLKTDLVDLVSGYTAMQYKGGNWWGLCPFHGEKTPSFKVTAEKQLYYCFGCHAAGNAIQFVKTIENMDFAEAVEYLAKRVNLPLPVVVDNERQRKNDRLMALTREAAVFFSSQLREAGSRRAVEYLQQRGLSPAIANRFGLGYALSSYDSLTMAMKGKGYSNDELLSAGLIVENKKGGYRDKFYNRLMFPIFDIRKRVVAFGGRVLGDAEPKYLNSPETAIFRKSRQLYALHEAKGTKTGKLILTEGYMDTLALYQAGFDNAIASLGTAFTEHHAALMARYVKEVVIAFDADGAGQNAVTRAMPLLQKAGLAVRILTMEGAKDPDEFIQKKGRAAFAAMVEGARDHADHTLDRLRSRFDLNSDAGRVDYLNEAIAYIAGLPGAVEREVYTRRTAELTGVSFETVAGEVKRKKGSAQRKQIKNHLLNPGGVPPKNRYANPRSAAAEENLLQVLLTDPSLWDKLPPDFTSARFSDTLLSEVFEQLRIRDGAGGLQAADFTAEAWSRVARIMNRPVSAASGEQALKDCLNTIMSESAVTAAEDDNRLAVMAAQYRQHKGLGGDPLE
jgi:DNA primase